jgi:hypothetical protein
MIDAPEPAGDVLEGVFFCDVVHKQHAHGVPVVRCGNGPEPFLTCSVQQLQFDLLAVQNDSSKLEVDADCMREAQVKQVVGKAQQQAALAYNAVPDQHQLD